MRKLSLLSTILLLLSTALFAQNEYKFNVDLVTVVKDQVKVTMVPPKMEGKETVMYIMPKVIPGSYAIKNYGRFVKKFIAYDNAGNKLKTKQEDYNKFYIYNATNLAKVEYLVDDTWDDKKKKNFVFQPGGSNIEANLNYMINPHCFFGYFEGAKMLPYSITVNKPEAMWGATYLSKQLVDKNTDKLSAPNYVFLADNPIMYCKPDTALLRIGKSNIHISVFSYTGKVKSSKVAEYLTPTGDALKHFFGELPVDDYHFIYYFDDPDRLKQSKAPGLSGGYGALEHMHSSLYYLYETDFEKNLRDMINDVSAHEFLHILTPLNIHSKEIDDFDFLEPKMSQHLWMYEGITEYFSYLVRIQDSIMEMDFFLKEMRDKINQAEEYGDFSMTEMSRNVLTPVNQELYRSVYNRGALIGMMLDIAIIDATKGKKTLKTVMMELAVKYGPSKPFNDAELIDEFVTLTSPELKFFFEKYITGSRPLSFDTYFEKIGIVYKEKEYKPIYMVGSFGMKYNESTGQFLFTEVGNNILGLMNNDALISVEGEEITKDNFIDLFTKYFRLNESPEQMVVKVNRGGKELTLGGKPVKGTATIKNYLTLEPKPNDVQQNNFKIFMGGR